MDPIGDKKLAKETKSMTKLYTLPDGQSITVNSPRFMAAEALFNPDLIKEGDNIMGIHEMAFAAIQDCNIDIRSEIYNNVLLSGGSSLYNGLTERLEKEIESMCPGMISIKDIPDR